MENKKVKLGFSPILIVGSVFSLIGLIFLGITIPMSVAVYGAVDFHFFVFYLAGGIMLILGLIFLVIPLRKRRRLQAMVNEGRYFWAEVVSVEKDFSVNVNGRHPIYLRVKTTDPQGLEHLFKSRNIMPPYVPDLIGKQVKVYAEQGNLKNYYVDSDPLFENMIAH